MKIIMIEICDDCPFFTERAMCKLQQRGDKQVIERGSDGLYDVPSDCPLDDAGREFELDFGEGDE